MGLRPSFIICEAGWGTKIGDPSPIDFTIIFLIVNEFNITIIINFINVICKAGSLIGCTFVIDYTIVIDFIVCEAGSLIVNDFTIVIYFTLCKAGFLIDVVFTRVIDFTICEESFLVVIVVNVTINTFLTQTLMSSSRPHLQSPILSPCLEV